MSPDRSPAPGLPPGFEWTGVHPLREPGLARARGVARVHLDLRTLQVSWLRYFCRNPEKDRKTNLTKTVTHYFSIFGVAICLSIARYSAKIAFLMILIHVGMSQYVHRFIHVDTQVPYDLGAPFGSSLLNPPPMTSFCQPLKKRRQAMWRALPSTANHDGRWKF